MTTSIPRPDVVTKREDAEVERVRSEVESGGGELTSNKGGIKAEQTSITTFETTAHLSLYMSDDQRKATDTATGGFLESPLVEPLHMMLRRWG